MKTIHAIYEQGVFRPTERIDLPDGTPVEVSLPQEATRQPQPTDPEFAHLPPELRGIHVLLAHRYEGGSPDTAARHDEHRP